MTEYERGHRDTLLAVLTVIEKANISPVIVLKLTEQISRIPPPFPMEQKP